MVEKLESRKKYGLIWDEEKTKERFENEAENALPILKEVKGKEIQDSSEPNTPHILIEGDNYHTLSVLNFTHQGAFDVIYADPPYNTGAKNWRYNNDYVDENDVFRHSKWLSFMKKRLNLARTLLKDEGIIIVTIDDYEVATLRLLMDEIFGEQNHLGTVVIKNNPSGRSTTAGFAVAHEYALFYSKSSLARVGRLQRSVDQIARYKEKDENGYFEWVNFRARYSTISPRLQYPIFIRKDGSNFRIPKLEWDSKKQSYILLEQPKSNESIKYPVDDSNQLRCWKWSIETVNRQKESDMAVRLDQRKNPAVYVKARMKDEGMLPLTWWDKTEYSATAYGTNLLSGIMVGEGRFDYPKSLYAVMDCLRVASEKKNALVLDFFAGSGTTGHAVLELNKEDGGSRRFVLCTNNENKICEEVTYPRIKKIMIGYANKSKIKVPGLGGSLKYFKTAFVKKTLARDDLKIRLTNECTEMLCLRERVFTEIKSTTDFRIFQQGGRFLAVYYSLERDALKILRKELDKLEGAKTLYCFTLDPLGLNKSDFIGWDDVVLEPIPQKILDVYKQIYEY